MSTTSSSPPTEQERSPFPEDLLRLIFSYLQDDYSSLFNCSLVNWTFNFIASKYLYRRVVLSPKFRPVLALRDTGSIPSNSNLSSASLPQYADLVEIIEIKGYLSPRPPPKNTLPSTIFNAITKFKNLHTAILAPTIYHEDVFTQVLEYFRDATSPNIIPPPLRLRELAVNASCTSGETRPRLLADIVGLSSLTIHSPTRAILELLPQWLRKLSDSLIGLHLKDNCGSVTPGVLKAILPLLQNNIRSISLGLSYSLTDEDVFTFLRRLPKLEHVSLQYYLQLRAPTHLPNLRHLHHFTAYHRSRMDTRKDVQSFCTWIRRTVFSSPVQTLRIVCIDDSERHEDDEGAAGARGPNIAFDSLIDHLCKRHAGTLRVLDFRSAYISITALRQLFESCKVLEEVAFCARRDALDILMQYAPSLSNLHTVSLNIRNIKPNKLCVDFDAVSRVLTQGPPALRRLSVNDRSWESFWISSKDGTIRLTVREKYVSRAPWEREPKQPPLEEIGARVKFA